jgi:hypothetical protein
MYNGAVLFLYIFLLGMVLPSCAGRTSATDSLQTTSTASEFSSAQPITSRELSDGTSVKPSDKDLITSDSISRDSTIYPGIMPSSKKGAKRFDIGFEFEDKKQKISVTISDAVLDGARRAVKDAFSKTGEMPADWEEQYDRALIDDPAQDSFYKSVLEQTRLLRIKLNLDDNRYLEMLGALVQHIPYDSQSERDARFPVETVGDNKGDCDDRSRLLAALLSREGYAAALLHFDKENHMAVGIKADGLEYRGTGWTIIETTSPSMVGFPFEENALVKLSTTPVAVSVSGSNTKVFTAADDIIFLKKTMDDMKKERQKVSLSLEKINRSVEQKKQ